MSPAPQKTANSSTRLKAVTLASICLLTGGGTERLWNHQEVQTVTRAEEKRLTLIEAKAEAAEVRSTANEKVINTLVEKLGRIDENVKDIKERLGK